MPPSNVRAWCLECWLKDQQQSPAVRRVDDDDLCFAHAKQREKEIGLEGEDIPMPVAKNEHAQESITVAGRQPRRHDGRLDWSQVLHDLLKLPEGGTMRIPSALPDISAFSLRLRGTLCSHKEARNSKWKLRIHKEDNVVEALRGSGEWPDVDRPGQKGKSNGKVRMAKTKPETSKDEPGITAAAPAADAKAPVITDRPMAHSSDIDGEELQRCLAQARQSQNASVIQLKSKGTMQLIFTGNLFELSAEDRQFVFDIHDKMLSYGRQQIAGSTDGS